MLAIRKTKGLAKKKNLQASKKKYIAKMAHSQSNTLLKTGI